MKRTKKPGSIIPTKEGVPETALLDNKTATAIESAAARRPHLTARARRVLSAERMALGDDW